MTPEVEYLWQTGRIEPGETPGLTYIVREGAEEWGSVVQAGIPYTHLRELGEEGDTLLEHLRVHAQSKIEQLVADPQWRDDYRGQEVRLPFEPADLAALRRGT